MLFLEFSLSDFQNFKGEVDEFKNHDDLVNASKKAHKDGGLFAPQRGEIIREFGNELGIKNLLLQK